MIRYLTYTVIALLLSACMTVPNAPELDVKPIVYSGRFTISYDKGEQTQREQGNFEWKVQDTIKQTKAMQLSLISPLGTTLALIAFNPSADIQKRASFTSPTQNEFAPDLDALMDGLLGWRLPLAALMPWLGKTAPDPSTNEWDIKVVNRHDSGLPKLITAANSALKLSARLVFEE